MSITHDTTTRTALLVTLLGEISPAALDIFDSSNVLLVSIPSPAYTNSGLSATLSNGPINANAVANGTAAYCRLRNSSNTKYQRYSDVRASSGGEVQLNSLSIVSGQVCTLSSHTITAPL